MCSHPRITYADLTVCIGDESGKKAKTEISGYNTVFLTAAGIVLFGAILVYWIKVPNEKTDGTVHVE